MGEAIKRYVESVIAARDDKSTAKHYAYWTERLGHTRLAAITADVIAAARDDLSAKTTRLGKPMAPATVKLYLESLSAVFKACRKEYRWTQYNPVRDVTMPTLPKGRSRYLDAAERAALLKACQESDEPRLYPFVLLAISTGARAGELTGLVWSDVNLERGVATLRDTKNGDMRALPIKGAALTAIKTMHDHDTAATAHVFAGPPGPIFDYAKPFNAARDAAGITHFFGSTIADTRPRATWR